MLERPEERVKLLKAGITGQKIEELYIKLNDFKILAFPKQFELIEIDVRTEQKKMKYQNKHVINICPLCI